MERLQILLYCSVAILGLSICLILYYTFHKQPKPKFISPDYQIYEHIMFLELSYNIAHDIQVKLLPLQMLEKAEIEKLENCVEEIKSKIIEQCDRHKDKIKDESIKLYLEHLYRPTQEFNNYSIVQLRGKLQQQNTPKLNGFHTRFQEISGHSYLTKPEIEGQISQLIQLWNELPSHNQPLYNRFTGILVQAKINITPKTGSGG